MIVPSPGLLASSLKRRSDELGPDEGGERDEVRRPQTARVESQYGPGGIDAGYQLRTPRVDSGWVTRVAQSSRHPGAAPAAAPHVASLSARTSSSFAKLLALKRARDAAGGPELAARPMYNQPPGSASLHPATPSAPASTPFSTAAVPETASSATAMMSSSHRPPFPPNVTPRRDSIPFSPAHPPSSLFSPAVATSPSAPSRENSEPLPPPQEQQQSHQQLHHPLARPTLAKLPSSSASTGSADSSPSSTAYANIRRSMQRSGGLPFVASSPQSAPSSAPESTRKDPLTSSTKSPLGHLDSARTPTAAENARKSTAAHRLAVPDVPMSPYVATLRRLELAREASARTEVVVVEEEEDELEEESSSTGLENFDDAREIAFIAIQKARRSTNASNGAVIEGTGATYGRVLSSAAGTPLAPGFLGGGATGAVVEKGRAEDGFDANGKVAISERIDSAQRAALKLWIERKLRNSGTVLTEAEIDSELTRLIREMRATSVSRGQEQVVGDAEAGVSMSAGSPHDQQVPHAEQQVEALSETSMEYTSVEAPR